MKIVFLTSDMDPSAGWGRFASNLIYGLEKNGHGVVILKERDDNFAGQPILKSGKGIFVSALRVRKYVKECDIIYAFDGYPHGVIAALANIGLNKKLIIGCQGTYSVAPLYNFKIYHFLKWAYKQADKIIAISNFTKNEILKKAGALNNICVINHGVEFDRFYKKHEEIDEKFIISVGGLKKRKGYHIAIPAFAGVHKKIYNLKYKIVGNQSDSSYFSYLKELVKKYELEDSVEFLNDVSDEQLSELYGQSKLFILPSVNVGHNFEGFGLVFLEAAAAGLPVVGTLGNGIEDAVKNGFNGLLVEQNNIEQTTQAMLDIINNSRKWNEMSSNSYIWAKEHDLKLVIDQYISVYNNVYNSIK